MLVGIIGAMGVEVTELISCMQVEQIDYISSIAYYLGVIDGRRVVIAKCGPGKVNAAVCAQAMILKYSPDIIINTGVAGSLSNLLSIGDCAIASAVVQYDMDTTVVGDPIGYISGVNKVAFECDIFIVAKLIHSLEKIKSINFKLGLIATGDKFLKSQVEKDAILKNFNAISCEMEGGSIGHVCCMNKIPFGVIRAISDNGAADSNIEYEEFINMAAQRSALVVKTFLEILENDIAIDLEG